MSKRIYEVVRILTLLVSFMSFPVLATEYTIEVQAGKESEDHTVQITAKTNIPGTIEVMGSVSLVGQSDDDVYIGDSKKFSITKGAGKVVFDTSDLPSGKYEAEVSFYPLWGFKDDTSKATGIDSNLEASKAIDIEGSGETSDSASAREEGQKWVMLNVIVGTSWSKGDWISRFGAWEEIPTKTRNPRIIKNYYFESIDMTIVANVLKDEVATWTIGKKGL